MYTLCVSFCFWCSAGRSLYATHCGRMSAKDTREARERASAYERLHQALHFFRVVFSASGLRVLQTRACREVKARDCASTCLGRPRNATQERKEERAFAFDKRKKEESLRETLLFRSLSRAACQRIAAYM